jgi:diguanylate cyclase (GGDEF)-like protein
MIVDLNIPEGGFKIIKEYRENPALRDIPVFAVTSTNLSPDERLEVMGQIEMVLCKDAIISKEIVNHLRNIEVLYPKKAGLIDELTGVFNYRYFQIRLAQEIRRSTRYNLPLVLLVLDVDQFGHYVNKKGDHYGNLVLKKIAEIIRKNIRGSDVLVRHGIDSFAIILTNTFLSSGLILAKRFVSMIHDYPFLYEDVQPKGKITISMGASEFKEHSPEELIHSVELALSSAITKGRNRVEVSQE